MEDEVSVVTTVVTVLDQSLTVVPSVDFEVFEKDIIDTFPAK